MRNLANIFFRRSESFSQKFALFYEIFAFFSAKKCEILAKLNFFADNPGYILAFELRNKNTIVSIPVFSILSIPSCNIGDWKNYSNNF